MCGQPLFKYQGRYLVDFKCSRACLWPVNGLVESVPSPQRVRHASAIPGQGAAYQIALFCLQLPQLVLNSLL